MRGLWIGLLALGVGCGSENGLYHKPASNRPTKEEPKTTEPTVPVPEGAATLKGTICAFDGDEAVTHAIVTVEHDAGPEWPESSETETDADGDFVLENLPPGTWAVRIHKGSFEVFMEVTLEADEVTKLDVDDCVPLEQGNTEIAVITGAYDDIGALLDELGLDYDQLNGVSGTAYVDFLRNPSDLAKYDIIFFNCGMGERWFDYKNEVGDNLKDYVRNGGSIYASDWAYWLIESGWPSENDFHGAENNAYTALVGVADQLDATVLDPAMIAALGADEARLNYNLDSWAAMDNSNAEVLIRGQFEVWQGIGQNQQSGPLATRIHDGDGMALYTTFHNEGQNTTDMLVLLNEIILSL